MSKTVLTFTVTLSEVVTCGFASPCSIVIDHDVAVIVGVVFKVVKYVDVVGESHFRYRKTGL